MRCGKCGKLSDTLRHTKSGDFVCDDCNPKLRCKNCNSEIEYETDILKTDIGERCVECHWEV